VEDASTSGKGEASTVRTKQLTTALLLVLAAAMPARATDDEPLEHLTGEYAFAGGVAEREALDRAIDRVVDRMPFLVRGIARARIHANVRPERRVAVAVTGDGRVRLRFDDWAPPPMRPGAPPRVVPGPEGGETRFSIRRRGERLETVAVTGEGTQERWISGSGDGRYLFVQVRIRSPQLPGSIRYTLSYRAARERLARADG
jgi:hypothetical protein